MHSDYETVNYKNVVASYEDLFPRAKVVAHASSSSTKMSTTTDLRYRGIPKIEKLYDVTKEPKEWYKNGLKELCKNYVITEHPPLIEAGSAYTAQYEHTILIRRNGVKEVLTRGLDF